MKVKVEMNLIKTAKLTKQQIVAAHMVAEQMRTEIIQMQLMPFDEGTLQNVQTYIEPASVNQINADNTVSIVHDTPYAARLYYHPEYIFQQTFNQNAGGEWWDEYLALLGKSRPVKLFKEFYRRVMGGIVK